MTDEESANISRLDVPLVQSGEATLRWPDENGPWQITAHWAHIDGRPIIVGLDLRSFVGVSGPSGEDLNVSVPIGDHLAEVTQRVLRGISISQIRDLTRQQMIERSLAIRSVPLGPGGEPDPEAEMPLHSMKSDDVATIDEWTHQLLTAKGEPRKRRAAATEDLLRDVAALYTQAVALGDKMPAKYVEEKLREAGKQLNTRGSRVLVRQWIRRARERGYLTVRPPTSEGA